MSRARSLRSVYLALDIADAGGYPGLDVREIISQLELFDEKNAATILKNSVRQRLLMWAMVLVETTYSF